MSISAKIKSTFSNSTVRLMLILFCGILFVAQRPQKRAPDTPIFRNLPKGMYSQLEDIGFFHVYKIRQDQNPFVQRGDFNGDNKMDIAVQVIGKLSGKAGIVIKHHREKYLHLIGAGKPCGDWGDDFASLSDWKVDGFTLRKSYEYENVDALVLCFPGQPKCLAYWNGKTYEFIEMDDKYYYLDSPMIVQPMPVGSK